MATEREICLALTARLALLVLTLALPAWAQSGREGTEIRELPASAQPPPEAAELEKLRGKKIPDPPGSASVVALVEKIKLQPGGIARLDKARQGVRPDRERQSWLGDGASFLSALNPLQVQVAYAATPFAVELTPKVDALGAHASLSSSSPDVKAYFQEAWVDGYNTNSSWVFLFRPGAVTDPTSTASNPHVWLACSIPTDGWYILNANASGSKTVTLLHWKGTSFAYVQSFTPSALWNDYPSLQYLKAGSHNFYYVFPGMVRVSRLSVRSYP